jgi:hypothetical protein
VSSQALRSPMDLEEHADAGRAEKATGGEIEGDRMLAAPELLVDRSGQFAGMFGIQPARHDEHESVGRLAAADRDVHVS